jgi:hypothetical protein
VYYRKMAAWLTKLCLPQRMPIGAVFVSIAMVGPADRQPSSLLALHRETPVLRSSPRLRPLP